MLERLAKVFFVIAILGIAFAYGVGVGRYKLFPYETVREGAEAADDLAENWKSYAGIEPTKWLNPARLDGRGVTVHDPARAYPGLTFMTGLLDGQVAQQLIDMDGNVVQRWIPDPERIYSDGTLDYGESEIPFNEWDAGIQGAQPLPDGSLLLHYSHMLVKLDKCSNPQPVLPGYNTHHSVFHSEDGTFWLSASRITEKAPPNIIPPFQDDMAMQISATGEILRMIPLPQLLIDNGLEAELYPMETDAVTRVDFMHLNDVEVLQSADADAFPMFEAGDVMVSFRNHNLIFVFDPDSLKVKWYQIGPWLRQHDPDFLPDGTIAVFNNRTDGTLRGTIFGGSNVMVVNPSTRETKIVYSGSPEKPFYTNLLGKHQYLPNGNFLITEAKAGRAFEIDDEGEIVWEYINRYDAERVAQMEEATRFPESYFTVEDWTCP